MGGSTKNDPKVAKFLKANPLAKILIIVDTHSTQDGMLVQKVRGKDVWSNSLGKVRPENSGLPPTDKAYKILEESLPIDLMEIISVESQAERRNQVMVLNMSCGESILDEKARAGILSGYACRRVQSMLGND